MMVPVAKLVRQRKPLPRGRTVRVHGNDSFVGTPEDPCFATAKGTVPDTRALGPSYRIKIDVGWIVDT